MDAAFHLPPVIEEVLDSSDELCELKEEKPITFLAQTLKLKEREPVEVKKAADGENTEGEEEEEEDMDNLRAQIIELLLELDQAREISHRHQDTFNEIQGLLEDERLASAHQAETFTRQIQMLQAQLVSLQQQSERVLSERDRELEEAREELTEVQAEAQMLQSVSEENAAEQENDIALLQEELCRVKAELQRATQHGDVKQLKDEVISLTDDNKQLSSEVEKLQQQEMSEGVYLAVRGDSDSYISMSQRESKDPERTADQLDRSLQDRELNLLRGQVKRAEENTVKVQAECDGLKAELAELQQLYDSSQSDRSVLNQELKRCKDQLEALLGQKAQHRDSEGWALAVAAVAVAAVVVLVVPSFIRG